MMVKPSIIISYPKGIKMNISSIVVKTLVKNLDAVVTSLKNCEACDYHMHDKEGRIIITIEGANVEEDLKKLRVVEQLPFVIAAEMQMAYSEDELDQNMEVLKNSDVIPKGINDNDINPEDILYNGDLKKKDLEAFSRQLDTAQVQKA